jgi:hypothetical protein
VDVLKLRGLRAARDHFARVGRGDDALAIADALPSRRGTSFELRRGRAMELAPLLRVRPRPARVRVPVPVPVPVPVRASSPSFASRLARSFVRPTVHSFVRPRPRAPRAPAPPALSPAGAASERPRRAAPGHRPRPRAEGVRWAEERPARVVARGGRPRDAVRRRGRRGATRGESGETASHTTPHAR